MKMTYTFDDLQIVPIYSEIESRRMCDTSTQITTNYRIDIPILSAPMDTVTDSAMAISLGKLGGLGVIHRFFDIQTQVNEVSKTISAEIPLVAAAIGVINDYRERAEALVAAGCKILLIDVAHGNTKLVHDVIEWCKTNLPDYVDIIAGSVATAEGAYNLATWGADGIRVGIGNGCFTPDMLVKTTNGLKRIVEVQIGDSVYTHTGEIRQVVDKFEYDKDEEIVIVNDIESTSNHEFYVIHISDVDMVDENNVHLYAKWIPAGELTDEYFLIELE